MVARYMEGDERLMLENYGELVAAFMTEVTDGTLDVFSLAGKRAIVWGKPLSRRLKAYARERECERVQFVGRRAHGRISDYGDALKVAGEIMPGVLKYEVAL